MKKFDLFLNITGGLLALAGLVLIIINIMSDGSPVLSIAMCCVLLSQALVICAQHRKRNQEKKK